MKRLTTRGIKTATAIRDREPFTTSGALSATRSPNGAGHLSQQESGRFFVDTPSIDYVVYSYTTPIAWHCTDTGWHKVNQKFSSTTSKHQGNLYMIAEGTRA